MYYLLSFTDGNTFILKRGELMVVRVVLQDGSQYKVEGVDDTGLMPGGFLGCVKTSSTIKLGGDGKGKVVAGFNAGNVVAYCIEDEATLTQVAFKNV